MYPPEVIQALKEALKNIHWYKDDLRLFLNALDVPAHIVAKQGWHDPQEYKVIIAGKILDELIGPGDPLVELGHHHVGLITNFAKATIQRVHRCIRRDTLRLEVFLILGDLRFHLVAADLE